MDEARVKALLQEQPNATKRDLSKILGLKGSDRIGLKRILKDLRAKGDIEGSRRHGYALPGALPEVGVLEIIGQDTDGELLARPTRWDGDEEPPKIIVVPSREDKGPAMGRGEKVLARLSEADDAWEARVIKRLGASAHRVLGVLTETPTGLRIAPIDRKSRTEFSVENRDRAGAEHNELVLAEPLAGRSTGLPRAKVIERLGSMSAPRSISLIAIHAHGIPTDFPDEVIAQAEAAQPVDPAGRTDLRNIPLITIDPKDARDHDDAIWAAPDPSPRNPGGWIALVAIADVAHYVKPGSALDREAYKRGNSVYFPDRVVPMLPEALSADLCSLKEGVDRACLAVRMIFDKNGAKKRHEFIRGVMRSASRLSYAQAQRAFGGHPDKDLTDVAKQTLADVWGCYQTLIQEREKRSPLDLDLPERRIVLGDDGKVRSIAFRERLESMKLIEEFMVLANVAAAESLENARNPLIYRVHDKPSKEKIFGLGDFLMSIGLSFDKGQVMLSGTFNRILKRAKGTPHELVMNDVVLRTQAQAVYASDNLGHFGLNLRRYAHFTSPIRRYADLIVHRALIKAHKLGNDGLTEREQRTLREIADHISMTERRAMAAERDSTDRYVAAYMEDRVGERFDVRITGVTRFGLFVRIPDSGAEGLVPVRALGTEFFKHDEKAHALIGDRTNTKYKLGDVISVKLAEAAPLTGGLRFDLGEPSKATKDFKNRFRPKKGPKGRRHY
ncbi:MAG: ribonuclease R [Alphaproteobacteria bacterium]|nr:ribonuclease R [Alphaproteobacteria bacterium]MBL6937793.1 ribonuclease R [Alphaproteobacteria bacterium]MBL7099381.1 ribonuclease R [Alphaproteobacteria bacterium]